MSNVVLLRSSGQRIVETSEIAPIDFDVFTAPLYSRTIGDVYLEHTNRLGVFVTHSKDCVSPVLVGLSSASMIPSNIRETREKIEGAIDQKFNGKSVTKRYMVGISNNKGLLCRADYIVPDVGFADPRGKSIAYRLTYIDGACGPKITLNHGLYSFYCSNGMTVGIGENAKFKHFKSAHELLTNIDRRIMLSLETFHTMQEFVGSLSRNVINDAIAEETIKRFTTSEREQRRLMDEWRAESGKHGKTTWVLMNVFTAWSSHLKDFPSMRVTNALIREPDDWVKQNREDRVTAFLGSDTSFKIAA